MFSQEAAHVSLLVGNTDSRQRDSGHLAVSTSAMGGRLDKTGAVAGCWSGDEAGGKPGTKRGVYEPAFKPLRARKGPRKKARVSNRTWEIRLSGIIGGPRKT
jgi:hypothetical protein